VFPELVRHTEKLYYFFEIANAGSYRAAARRLGLSAPALTYSMNQLEDAVNARIFHRSTKGVVLTEAGETLLSFCRRYFRDMEQTQLQIRRATEEHVERIKVGTFPSIAIYFWPSLLESWGEDTGFSLSITTDRSQNILEKLTKRDIDVALTVEDFQYSDLIKHELYKDHYAFYCSADWETTRIKPEDSILYPILLIPDAIDADRRTIRQHLDSWGLIFRDDFDLDSFEVIGEFVCRGYGIGILPTKVATTYGDRLQKFKISGLPTHKFGTHRFFLSYREDLDIPQRLMNSLLAAARQAVRLQNQPE
jgi:DNA-binding transcriptional LysR family regulator